jgi:hypothetical protein
MKKYEVEFINRAENGNSFQGKDIVYGDNEQSTRDTFIEKKYAFKEGDTEWNNLVLPMRKGMEVLNVKEVVE